MEAMVEILMSAVLQVILALKSTCKKKIVLSRDECGDL
jgi:hypothetical protein